MSQQPQRPSGANAVSAGPASDAKTVVAAALLTFAAGMIVLVGYLLVGGFGAFLGIIGAVFAGGWWKLNHDNRIFPRDLPTSHLLLLALAGAAMLGLTYVMS